MPWPKSVKFFRQLQDRQWSDVTGNVTREVRYLRSISKNSQRLAGQLASILLLFRCDQRSKSNGTGANSVD